MKQRIFAPGCAHYIFQQEQTGALRRLLFARCPCSELEDCCRGDISGLAGSSILTLCPGCDKKFHTLADTESRTLWEMEELWQDFPFPDYGGRPMALLDHCGGLARPEIGRAVRRLLERMNLTLLPLPVGPCCGGKPCRSLPPETVLPQIEAAARTLEGAELCVYGNYCWGYFSQFAKVHTLEDLLLGRETPLPPADWREQISAHMKEHL